MPIVQGRGAGLGNELFVWGKAFIAARAMGLRLLKPAFGMNARGYARDFGTPPLDWLAHRVLRRVVPTAIFSEADYRAREPMPFADAVVDFAQARLPGRGGPLVLGLEGMWGGLSLVEPARDYLKSQLLSARSVVGNLYALDRRLSRDTLRIGFHIRRGDFGSTPGADGDYRGRFNVAIPLDWYVAVARNLMRLLGSRATFLVVSDAPAEQLAPFGTDIPCVFTDDMSDRDISDLMALSRCDLIVCSISSYSLWATFFSTARYVWFAPNLTTRDGLSSIWGHEPTQTAPTGETARAHAAVTNEPGLAPGRGVASGWDGTLPPDLIEDLIHRHAMLRRETDLVRYGVVTEGM